MIRWLISALGLVPVSEVTQEADLETQLKMFTSTHEERKAILQSAVILGQCGITPDELPGVISRGMSSHMRVVIELQRWAHLDPRIEKRIADVWAGE